MPFDFSLSAAPLADPDPLSLAVGSGLRAATPMDRRMLEAAERACREVADASAAHAALGLVLELVASHPGAERPQILAARLIDRIVGRAAAIAVWRGVSRRLPRCHEAVLLCLRWTVRTEGRDAAKAEIDGLFPFMPETASDLLLLARAWHEVGDRETEDRVFACLLGSHPGFETGWLMRAQAQERRGDPWAARETVSQAREILPRSPRLSAMAARLRRDVTALGSLAAPPIRGAVQPHAGQSVAAHLIARSAASRGVDPARTGRVGRVVMIGGSLGAGGAERQMVNTAIALQAAHDQGRQIDGHAIVAPPLVVCRSVTERAGGDFLVPELRRHGVSLKTWQTLPGPVQDASCAPDVDLFRFLPPRMAEGTLRLTGVLRREAPDIVHLWQDGSVLAAGLACLLAGIPRIVISARTAPPPDRPERDLPEYAVLYGMLARMPGVALTVNSRFAADRYEAWLGLEAGSVGVIPNGLCPQRRSGAAPTRAMEAAFTAATQGGFTVGCVCRLDENKRPLLWLHSAARLAASHPDARFILVGDGPLRDQAQLLAQRLGIAARTLFVGRTDDVGFWLERMDALLLLSRCEGLPNVLIEAQSAGVPVITTPAGGAAETLLAGRTGFVLGSAETPDMDEIIARLSEIADGAGRRDQVARTARQFVAERFSMASMIGRTVGVYLG